MQYPVYYISKAFQRAEERYTLLEKMALALVSSTRKLRPYFQGHPIRVPKSYLLRQALQNPELSGRIAKWVIELGEFDIEYIPHTAVKAQALADFVAEFTGAPEPTPEYSKKAVEPVEANLAASSPSSEMWKLFVDGSSNSGGSGAGLVLVSSNQYKTSQALRFNFKASNNEAEYEAVIAGLGLAWELGV